MKQKSLNHRTGTLNTKCPNEHTNFGGVIGLCVIISSLVQYLRGYALEIPPGERRGERGREKIFKRAELMVIRRTRSN